MGGGQLPSAAECRAAVGDARLDGTGGERPALDELVLSPTASTVDTTSAVQRDSERPRLRRALLPVAGGASMLRR